MLTNDKITTIYCVVDDFAKILTTSSNKSPNYPNQASKHANVPVKCHKAK